MKSWYVLQHTEARNKRPHIALYTIDRKDKSLEIDGCQGQLRNKELKMTVVEQYKLSVCGDKNGQKADAGAEGPTLWAHQTPQTCTCNMELVWVLCSEYFTACSVGRGRRQRGKLEGGRERERKGKKSLACLVRWKPHSWGSDRPQWARDQLGNAKASDWRWFLRQGSESWARAFYFTWQNSGGTWTHKGSFLFGLA